MSKVTEIVEENIEETTEETKVGFLPKVRGFAKKNGKKIAAVAAVVVGGIVIYAVSKNAAKFSDGEIIDITDAVTDDVTDVMTEA